MAAIERTRPWWTRFEWNPRKPREIGGANGPQGPMTAAWDAQAADYREARSAELFSMLGNCYDVSCSPNADFGLGFGAGHAVELWRAKLCPQK